MVGTTIGRRRQTLAGICLVATFMLGACGGSDFRYVVNSQENLFFKVPKTWKKYAFTSTDKDGRPVSLPEGFERIWHYGFDGDAQPDPAHFKAEAPEHPIARAEVWALSAGKNDQMSLSEVRNLAFRGIDPLLQDAGTPPRWEVVDMAGLPAKRLEFPKGVTGTRMAINLPNSDDATKFHTVDATTLVDPLQRRVYLLMQSCSSQCYLDNRKAIDGIAESWTVNRT
jgi:hypothetical protein